MEKGMIKKLVLKFFVLFTVLFSFSVFMTSCDSWMEDDDFYEDIDREVKVANAPQIQVYVRYAATKMGKTNPDGYDTFKVEIEHEISATTETDYGFKKWAAFPTSFIVPGDTQYTDFLYVDDEDYAERYGKNELGDDVVHFADIYSPVTNVTVMQERNDIYIVPVVARRPTVALTIPGSGSSNIVRNMTARISFTKPMNPDSFKNSSGIVDKITISQGTQSISADGDIDINSEDITDHFEEPVFSKNGKMITLKFKEDYLSEGYTAQSYVSIDISREVTDIYGYAMADDYKLSFQVGSSFDTLAPRITDLTAGVGEHFTDFSGFYKDQNMHTTLGSYTTFPSDVGAPQALPSSLGEDYYSGHVIDQRMKDKITIRIFAEDIAGSGSGRDQMGVESDVTQIGIRATRLFDMDGNAVSGEENTIPISSNAYVPQVNGSELEASYTDLMSAENERRQQNGLSTFDSGKGCLYTYDLSSLGDGLIRIDIAAVDAVGNSGFADGGNYSAEYGNGYATIFVVKDNLQPDATAQASNITSTSSAAVYGWYNLSTYNTITITQTASLVKDAGHQKLACLPEKLKWIIKATPDTSWVSGVSNESEEWKLISEGWALGNFTPPSTDGALGITYAIMDDLGNISSGGTISSIMYDCTAPVFGSSSWVNSSGEVTKNTANANAIPSDIYLKLPFTEATSGVKKISVTVDNSPATPTYYYNGTGTQWTCTGGVFNSANTSGTLYIQNIPLGEHDGDYTVRINLTDQALNTSSEYTSVFSRDTAVPVINSVDVVGIQNNFVPNGNVTVKINATETGSGIDTITFSTDSSPNGTSQVYFGSLSSSPVAAVVSGNTITLTNHNKTGTGACDIYVTNVTLSKAEGVINTISVTLKDYAGSNSTSVSREGVKKDGTAPTITSVNMQDTSSSSNAYTKNQAVNFVITGAADNLSGLKKLKFTGATVTATGSDTYEVLTPNSSFTIPVTITDATNGLRTVSVNAYDLVGNESTAYSASITLDTVVPAIGTMSWDVGSTGMQPGIFNGTKMDQALVIPFTEATAGVNKITIDVKMPSGASYNQPLATDLIVTDGANTLTQGTDYSISGKIITLTEPRTSGTLKISGIHVAGSAVEGTYTFEAKLTDAAGNVMENPASLTANNDSTAPVITKLYVPGIVSVGNDYWISKEYAYEGTAHPVEIELTVKENNSGISKIEFDTENTIDFKNVTVKLNNDLVGCTTDLTAKTITIDPENAINKNGTNESVTIKIEGVCVFTSYYINNRTIKLKVYDVAGNVKPTSYGTIASDGDGIPVSNAETIHYANSSPNIRSVTLTDRSDTGHKAQEGFTNEQYVNLEIELTSISTNSCPVYKITLDGATFDNTGENLIRVKNGSSSINVTSDQLIISNDKKSLAIKSGSGYAEMANGSPTAGSYKNTITINNVKLDSATEGAHTVNVTVTNACQFTASTEYTITLDTTKPTWNTTNPLYSYYDSSYASKIYPTPQASSKAYGPVIGSDQYFYTAFKDGSDTTESCYVAGDCTESNLLGFTTSGATLSAENTAAKLIAGNTEYSIVAVDKAGNVSDVKKCYVKAENSKESINVSELYNRITLVKPDASADIYRMDRHEDTTIKNADIKYQNSGDSWNIYAYKTVIKSTTNNYVIKVKMGSGLTASDKKIFGGSVTPTSDSFTNYNPTTTHSPVTAYTVTHYYRHWADSYAGLRTFEPRFPDETYSFNLQSYFNSSPSYGWTNSEYESTTSNCTWHEMSKRNVTNIDDQISSYVDNNGDINIMIPTTGKIPPLTLLLKNGTGQLNYVYLTELSSGTTEVTNAWNDVTTWEVDDKLGGAKVRADGSTGKRTIVINPINTEGAGEKWGDYEYAWGNQASTTAWESSKDGNSTIGFAIKNKVNKTTYYTNDVKAGLFIDNNSGHELPGAPESITFTVTGNRSDPANAEQVAAGEYTARAKLYCTKSSTAPTYSTIVNASETNGQVTPWCYVRTKADQGTVFFMDYPHPDYSALGWNNPKEPYYIYYLVEDRVGNYEIQTVVNSERDTDMVKWLYDAEGPKVTLRGKTTSPANVTTNVSDLVPNNNGYKASYNDSKYYTWWSTNQTGTYNDAQGKGTTRTVGAAPERKNAPFFDIDVTDDSGIRAFAYSDTYIENPKVSTFSFYTAEQGEGTWFGGQGSPTKDTIIGESWTDPTYNDAGKYKVLKADGSVDISYNNVYTGAAVCSVLPLYEATLTGKEIYLYVMDWVGNVSCTKMGNFTWNKDTTPPSANSTKESYSDKYYINSAGTLEFAGKKVVGLTSTKVYLPSDFYTDSGSSVFGWSLTQNKVDTIQKDSTGSYIELTLSDYNETATPKTVYVYDGVGNCKDYSYNISKDSTPPSYNLYVRSNGSGTTGSLYVKDVGYNQHGHTSHPKNYLLPDDLNLTTRLTESLYTDEASIKASSYYVYTDENGITFLPNSSEVTVNSKIDIFKWSGTQWNKVSSYTSTNSTGGTFQIETNWCTCPTIQVDGTNAGYFCFALSDRAGNTNYAYVYAKKDVTPPAVETICTNVNTIGNKNYYGPYGSVKYKVTQYDSGIYQINTEDPLSTYTTEVGPRNYLGTSNPYSVVVYNNNRKGETVNLEWNGVSTWSYDYSTPSCGSISSAKQYIANNHYSQADKPISGVNVTRKQGEGYSSITISPTNTSHVSTVSVTGVSSFTINDVSAFVGSTTAKGWRVIPSSSGVPTKPDFISWNDIDVDETNKFYTFNSSNWTDKSYYFYPVNYAGTVGDPIVFSFETPIKPTVTKESVTGDYNNTSTNVTYFNKSSELKIKVTNPNSSKAIKITSYSISKKNTDNTFTTLKAEQFNEQNYINITPNSNEIITVLLDATDFESLNSENLYVQVQTEFTASDEKSFGKFCYDNTPPAISLSSVLCNSQAAGYGYQEGNSVIYGNNTSTVQLTLSATETGSGLKGYALSEDATTWSTDPITINRGATGFASSYTIYAKDNLGNVGSQAITFTLDSTIPNPPAYSVKNESDLQYVHYVYSENKLYISKDSIELRATSAATNVYTYKCNTQTSQSGEFTINTAGTYYFCVVNNVGNESNQSVLYIVKDTVAPVTPTGTLTFYKDSTVVTKGFEVDATNRKVRFNPNLVNKAVFTPSAQTDDAATSGDGVGSGIAGYSNSRTATDWADTVTFDLSSSDNNTSKKVYVKDNVGNVCTSSLSYSFTADSTGPEPSGSIKTEPLYGSFKSGDTPAIKGIYVSTSEVPTTFVYDDIVGNNYVSLIYTPGDDFTVSLTDSDCVGYAFTCGCDSSATTQPASFTAVTPENKIITVPMPECELPHYYIFLWLQDSIGNVSVYNLIQDNNGEKNWWLSTESSHNVKYSYAQSSGNLTITGLACIPLKSIMITGENIYNISTNSITFDFNIPTNYMSNKSYNKNISWSNNGSGSFTGTLSNAQLTGTGTIVINIGNSATNINVRINSENGSSGIVASPNTSGGPSSNKFIQMGVKVRDKITSTFNKNKSSAPKEKKVNLSNKSVVTSNTAVAKSELQKKNSAAEKSVKSDNVIEEKVIKSRKTKKSALQGKITDSAVAVNNKSSLADDKEVMEAASFDDLGERTLVISEKDNSEVEFAPYTVEKGSAPKDYTNVIYIILACVMVCVITLVVFVNKKIVDKTKN